MSQDIDSWYVDLASWQLLLVSWQLPLASRQLPLASWFFIKQNLNLPFYISYRLSIYLPFCKFLAFFIRNYYLLVRHLKARRLYGHGLSESNQIFLSFPVPCPAIMVTLWRQAYWPVWHNGIKNQFDLQLKHSNIILPPEKKSFL